MRLDALLLLGQDATSVYYRFGRVQSLNAEWWFWFVLALAVIAITAYVAWMYRKDSVELPRGLAVLLFTLRVLAWGGILFFFLNLEKRAERQLIKNSRAIVLIDTSQSMGLRDAGSSSGGGTASAAGPSRIESVVQELAGGALIESLRQKHDVVIQHFDQGENPVELASYPRKPPLEETTERTQTEESRLAQLLREARFIAILAAVILGLSLVSGLVYLFFGRKVTGSDQHSWSLLVCMTTAIAAVIILGVASLRSPELSLAEIVGLRQPQLQPAGDEPSSEKRETVAPTVDWAVQLAPRGAETRIGDSLKYVIDKERGGPIAGIVLMTDGGQNAGADVSLALTAAQDSLLPIFAVGMGSDRRPVNLRVVDLEAPERVYPGDKFTLTGYVQAQGTNRSSVAVELYSADEKGENESREDDLTVEVGKLGQVTPVKFELTPTAEGIRTYKLRVKPLEGEIERRDNEKTAKVEVLDRKTKVLLLAGGPSREFIFLRNQLFRDKETTVDVLLQSARPGLSQDAHEILLKFPENEDDLFDYDAIVAFDPDWDALDELQVKLLERWVAEKAGGLIVVAGPVFTPQWSSRRRGDPRIDTIKSLYPVSFYYQGSATLSLGRFGSAEAWPLTFTRDGQEAEFLWLDDDQIKSERAWQEFPGIYGYYAVKDPKPGARIYARFSDPDTSIDGELPIYMAGHFYGSGRVFFQASGEMWRVRELDDIYFEQYYTKLIRWASEGRLLRDSSRGVLLVDKDRALLGDQIAVRAILQDAQFQPLTQNEVNAVLIQPDAIRLALVLKKVKDAAREGMYSEQFTALQEGDYKIELQHPAAAEQLLVREVRAKIPALETERPERNDVLLREIAEKTGAEYYVGLDAALGRGGGRPGVANLLKPQDQITVLPGTPDRRFEQLLMTWLMALICGVLCLEWLLRRLSKLA